MPLVLNGTTGVQDNSGAFVAGTAVASTSGTSIDFTGIPSWVKRITVMFSDVSTNSTSNWLLQLGDSGGIETTGYTSGSGSIDGSSTSVATSTTGFVINKLSLAAYFASGSVVITNISPNTWVCSGTLAYSVGGFTMLSGGSKATSATLDRVRITTTNGTDTFDAGSINILYE